MSRRQTPRANLAHFECMLDFKAHELGDLVSLPKFLDQLKIGQVLHIVLEGGQDEVKQSIGIKLEVANQLLDIFFHLIDCRCINIFLIELNYEF